MQVMQKTAYWFWYRHALAFAGRLRVQNRSQILLVMKLTVFFLTAAFLNVYAAGISQAVTLSGKNIPLKQVFQVVEEQTGYVFFYNQEVLNVSKPVSVQVQNMPLRDFLNMTLKDQQVSFRIADKTIMLSRKQPLLEEQVFNYGYTPPAEPVKGLVLTEGGRPLADASILVKGKQTHTTTDTAGRFSIAVSAGETLVITYVGYETLSYKVTAEQVKGAGLTIRMKQSVSDLGDVVVSYNTGYQTITKERATGSFAKPDMEVFKTRTATNDIMSRLDGLVAGLTVMQGPGQTRGDYTGGRTQKALIRGTSSVLQNTDPLYVVNGVPVPNFNNINPDDVEDITVLKDAAAAAIWGAKAANGVVVVVTQSGKNNAGLKVGYSGYANFRGKPDLGYMHVLSSPQYIQAAREITADPAYFDEYPYSTLSRAFVAPHEQILYDQNTGLITEAEANRKLDSLAAISNTSQIKDLMYRNAITSNHTVTVSGGTRIYSVYSSLSYTNTQNNIPGGKNEAFRLNVNQQLNPGKNLNVSLFTSLQNNVVSADNSPTVGGIFFPYQLFRDQYGNNVSMPYMGGLSRERMLDYQTRSRVSLDYNPLNDRGAEQTNTNNITINLTGNVGLTIWKGLRFQGSYGYQRSPNRTSVYTDNSAYQMRSQLVSFTVAPTAASTPVYYLPNYGGKFATTNGDARNWTVRNQLLYSTALRGNKDELNFQFGQEAQEQSFTSNYSVLRGYDKTLKSYAVLDYYSLANTGISGTVTSNGRVRLAEQPFSFTEVRSRFRSYFALFSYAINKKYYIDASWRRDNSSLIGSSQATQNRPIWSFGSKWAVSKEHFMKPYTWLDNLAVRATYGITGNSPSPGSASSKDILNPDLPVGSSGPGMYIWSPANQSLAWESTRTLNTGIDFSVFNSRISGSVEYYHKKTTNLVGVMRFNPFSSFGNENGNLGNLLNRGLEISLQTINVSKKHFTWTSNLVFSYNNNKLVSYVQNPLGLSYANAKVAATYLEGYSMNSMFAYRYAGLDNMGDPQIKLKDGSISKEYNVATVDDIVYVGSAIPVYNGGFSNTFSYKGISLTANISYSFGHVMRRDLNDFFYGRLTGSQNSYFGNINAEFASRWKKPGDELTTVVPSYIASELDNDRRFLNYYTMADINTVSAASIKLRDVTLSYSLPAAVVKRMKMRAVSFYVQTSNYLLWAANDYGIDPEFHDARNGARSLPDYRHSVSVGTNISF